MPWLFLALLFIFSPLQAAPTVTIEQIETWVEKKVPEKKAGARLAQTLKDPNAPVLLRERAAWAIGELVFRKRAPSLIEGTKSKSLLIRSASLDGLIRMRARSALARYKDIANSDPVLSMRQKATVALGLLRWEKAIDPLVALSSDKSAEVRGAATLSMAATHSDKNDFREILMEMTEDKSPYVQSRANIGLAMANDESKKVQTYLKYQDPDIRLFSALYFHYEGRGPDVEPLKAAKNVEADDDVRYELTLALEAIRKRIKKQRTQKRKQKLQKKATR